MCCQHSNAEPVPAPLLCTQQGAVRGVVCMWPTNSRGGVASGQISHRVVHVAMSPQDAMYTYALLQLLLLSASLP